LRYTGETEFLIEFIFCCVKKFETYVKFLGAWKSCVDTLPIDNSNAVGREEIGRIIDPKAINPVKTRINIFKNEFSRFLNFFSKELIILTIQQFSYNLTNFIS